MSTLSTHVLDAVRGVPASGIAVEAFARDAEDRWQLVGSGTTDDDGRIPRVAEAPLAPGIHRIVFATADYFAAQHVDAFYPEVAVTFTVDDERHYHVPLLLSPFAFSTYRGS
ncbi:hydroxyisourate hydrolase [Allobranchiibius sp. CTAmp26]|uniref:hydroxyisourate hydrolase n=1 Tax=Allobranchiibius sp. CTAmp26 TaxID=2815214 RepID=UPI001AA0F2EB|nr:hydroxyisourate hydrolase [Allobranchiibius sp. CTAmp26]MBO1756621.1 hydroxyisourate hydrolase [Allobranchiibius sp. CTAmp26]